MDADGDGGNDFFLFWVLGDFSGIFDFAYLPNYLPREE